MLMLERALNWIDAGYAVFICHDKDVWVGSSFHRKKSPATRNGHLDAVSTREEAELMWAQNPNGLVGVVIGDEIVVLDIDLDLEKGTDGYFTLESNALVFPDSYSVTTPSGGRHVYFKNTSRKQLGPGANIKLADGRELDGVDRRAGSSYAIAYSDIPPKREKLADAPDWLCVSTLQREDSPFSGKFEDWFNSLPQGEPDTRVARAMNDFPDGDFGHQVMITKQAHLVRLGAEGCAGVPEALVGLLALWTHPPFDKTQYQLEWNAALEGAVRKFGGVSEIGSAPSDALVGEIPSKATTTPEQEIEARAERLYIEKKAAQLADTRIEAEGFSGSQVLSIDDLKATKNQFIVQDLLPNESIAFLVAISNLGKTFAYVDLICRMIHGMPWLGKETRPIKILIVLGEGKAGFYERLEAWFKFHDLDIEIIRDYLSFIDGANLFNDQSLAKLSEVASQNDCGLIVLDTWAATSGVADENAGSLNSAALNRAMTIKPGATLLFVHHPTKSSEKTDHPDLRGSSALKGRADLVMTMYQDKGFKPSTGESENFIALSTEVAHGGKNRNARTETIRGLYLHETEDEQKVFLQIESEALSKNAVKVRTFLKGRMTADQLGKAMKKSYTTAKRCLDAAVAEGIALKIQRNCSTEPDLYELTSRGSAANQINWAALTPKEN
jgi:RecA-family ATPase